MDLLAFILAISADGVTDEQVQTALNAYIAEHPEAVTTVTDGSITKAKLDSNLQATVDDVGGIKSAIEDLEAGSLSAMGASSGQVPTADGEGSWNWQKPGVKNCDPQSIAIASNGDIHASIASGQYVYVQNHSTLAEGLYTAREAIQVNGELSLSKLTAVSNGGLNALNSIIPVQLIHMGTENDYPLSAAHTEYPMGITLIYTLSSTSYPYGTGTVVTIRAANARCVQFSFGNTTESCSMRAADNNGWSAWKTYSGS